jgi:hypothetical protein
VQSWFGNAFYANSTLTTVDDARFVGPFNYNNPDYTPFGTSPAVSGAKFTDSLLAGMSPVTFRGAIANAGADATWWKGWTRF